MPHRFVETHEFARVCVVCGEVDVGAVLFETPVATGAGVRLDLTWKEGEIARWYRRAKKFMSEVHSTPEGMPEGHEGVGAKALGVAMACSHLNAKQKDVVRGTFDISNASWVSAMRCLSSTGLDMREEIRSFCMARRLGHRIAEKCVVVCRARQKYDYATVIRGFIAQALGIRIDHVKPKDLDVSFTPDVSDVVEMLFEAAEVVRRCCADDSASEVCLWDIHARRRGTAPSECAYCRYRIETKLGVDFALWFDASSMLKHVTRA